MPLSPDQLDPRNDLQWYTRAAVRNADMWTDKAVRAEYSRLRDIAQKRLKRLEIKEPESYAYKTNKSAFAPARGQTTEELRALLPELAKFIAAKTGTVSGIQAQRRKAVDTMRGHGYTFVTQENYKEFAAFMAEWRNSKANRSVGSPDAVEAFEFTQESEIKLEDVKDRFADYLKDQKKLQSYVRKENKAGRQVSSDNILAEFDRLEQVKAERKAAAAVRRQAKRKRR